MASKRTQVLEMVIDESQEVGGPRGKVSFPGPRNLLATRLSLVAFFVGQARILILDLASGPGECHQIRCQIAGSVRVSSVNRFTAVSKIAH